MRICNNNYLDEYYNAVHEKATYNLPTDTNLCKCEEKKSIKMEEKEAKPCWCIHAQHKELLLIYELS